MKADKLVCIANVKTGEVIRIAYEKAILEFLTKKNSEWRFTYKKIYKQYIESKAPESKIPSPVFITDKGDLQHVFIGHASFRKSKRKSSCNKKGKYRFQSIKENTIKRNDKEELKPARIIRHIK